MPHAGGISGFRHITRKELLPDFLCFVRSWKRDVLPAIFIVAISAVERLIDLEGVAAAVYQCGQHLIGLRAHLDVCGARILHRTGVLFEVHADSGFVLIVLDDDGVMNFMGQSPINRRRAPRP